MVLNSLNSHFLYIDLKAYMYASYQKFIMNTLLISQINIQHAPCP